MKLLRRILAGIFAAAIVYSVLEGGFRLYRYETLISGSSIPARSSLGGPADANGVVDGSRTAFAKYAQSVVSSFESTLDILDRATGFQYKRDAHVHQRLYDAHGNLLPHISVINTNNFGLLSPSDNTVAKPATEYRIAVLGDSFCATTTSSLRWTTALEGVLEENGVLKELPGKTAIKVLNFCLDGTGFVQWPDVYKYKAEQFQPDLVIVSFMWNDLFRKYMYRDTINVAGNDYAMITCSTLPATLANPNCHSAASFILDPEKEDYRAKSFRIEREIYRQMVRRLPWFSPYPELLGTVLQGRFGLRPRLVLRPYSAALYTDPEQAIQISLEAVEKIASLHPQLMVLFHPTIEECLNNQTPMVVQQFMERAKSFKVANMLDLLPLGSGETEIRAWYNAPYDAHPSDYGAVVYARAVGEHLRTYLAKQQSSPH